MRRSGKVSTRAGNLPPSSIAVRLVASLLAGLTLAIPLEGAVSPAGKSARGGAEARRASSDSGEYLVSWSTDSGEIPVNETFDLFVEIALAESGQPLEGCTVKVDADMPAHGHGMTRRPVVELLRPGSFVAPGMLLHMEGTWRLRVDVIHEGRFDRAEFEIRLDGGRSAAGAARRRALAASPLGPVPPDPTNAFADDPDAARLGQYLFFDSRLSRGGETSCATCHLPGHSWTDGKRVAAAGKPLARNTISLWNVAYGRWFFWDGRKDSLWSQALAPLEDPREHASDRVSIVRFVHEDRALRRAYERIFGPMPPFGSQERFPAARPRPGAPDDPLISAWNGMSEEDRRAVNRAFSNLGKSIAAYERQIVSRSAPFDAYVAALRSGDEAGLGAISDSAKRGLDLFFGEARCHLCHSGPAFTDFEFHDNRAPLSLATDQVDSPALDAGRFAGARQVIRDEFHVASEYSDVSSDADRAAAERKLRNLVFPHVEGEMKTPTLRNVAKTAPYMHRGQFDTLEEVVAFYSSLEGARTVPADSERLIRPLELDDTQRRDLVAFLESLTDEELPARLMTAPSSPILENAEDAAAIPKALSEGTGKRVGSAP